MTIAVDMGRKAAKKTKHKTNVVSEISGEPALLCNLARATLLTNWMKTKAQTIKTSIRTPTKKLCFNFFYSKFTKTRTQNKRNKKTGKEPIAASS